MLRFKSWLLSSQLPIESAAQIEQLNARLNVARDHLEKLEADAARKKD